MAITYSALTSLKKRIFSGHWFSDPDRAKIEEAVKLQTEKYTPPVLLRALEKMDAKIVGAMDSTLFYKGPHDRGTALYKTKTIYYNVDRADSSTYGEEPYHLVETEALVRGNKKVPGFVTEQQANELVRQTVGPIDAPPGNQYKPARQLFLKGENWVNKEMWQLYGAGEVRDNGYTPHSYPEVRVNMMHVQNYLVEKEMLKLLLSRMGEIEADLGRPDSKRLKFLKLVNDEVLAVRKKYAHKEPHDQRSDDQFNQAREDEIDKVLTQPTWVKDGMDYPMLRERILDGLAKYIRHDEVEQLHKNALGVMEKTLSPLFRYYKDTVEERIPEIAGMPAQKLETVFINRPHPMYRVSQAEVGTKDHKSSARTKVIPYPVRNSSDHDRGSGK